MKLLPDSDFKNFRFRGGASGNHKTSEQRHRLFLSISFQICKKKSIEISFHSLKVFLMKSDFLRAAAFSILVWLV